MYEPTLRKVFGWWITGLELGEAFELVAKLAQPEPNYPPGATSFALTVRPRVILWLSDASRDRLGGWGNPRIERSDPF